MPLLRTFAPFPDESGLGYYRRLSSANRLLNWRELAQLAQVSTYRTSLFGRPDFLASQLGLETSWSAHASHQEATARSWKSMHRNAVDAVCPECLKEQMFVRNAWEHALVTACPRHGCLLLERCPACNCWLSPDREHIHTCACGYELVHSQVTTAHSVQQWISAQITGTVIKPEVLKFAPTHVDPVALPQLIKLLCNHADTQSPGPRRNCALPQSVTEAVEFMKPLESMLQNWPHGFEDHVRARIAAGPSDARTLNSLLGNWFKGLKKACSHPSLSPFLDVTLRVAQECFDGRITGFDAPSITDTSLNFIPVAQAAKWLGISRDYLTKAVNAGHCEHRSMRFGTRGRAYEVPQTEVERLELLRRQWMSEEEACNYLGVPSSILKNMLCALVLVHDTQWKSDIFKGGPIERASVVALENTVKSLMQAKPTTQPLVHWSELSSRRMGDKSAIQSVMKAIAAGELRAIHLGRSLGEAAFLKDDVMRYFGTPLLEAGMSVQQLAQSTGWKWETIAHWIEQGLLECEQIRLRGQPCKVVSPNQLLDFRRTYIPLSDLARAMGTRSSTLSEKLVGIDIVGAKVESSGAKRGGLVRVEDLGRWAVSGLAASRGSLFGQQSLL